MEEAREPARVAHSREDEPYGEHTVSRLHPLPRGFNLPTVRQTTVRRHHAFSKHRRTTFPLLISLLYENLHLYLRINFSESEFDYLDASCATTSFVSRVYVVSTNNVKLASYGKTR